LGCV
jgi:hypothetical protein